MGSSVELNLQHQMWSHGDTFRGAFVKPGLFVYSGFGMGHYFSVSGCVVWTTNMMAAEMARTEGSPWLYFDPLFSLPSLPNSK
jgi:hypothetical protein